MATVKTIDVALRADVSKFESGLSRASAAVGKFVGPVLGGLASKLSGLSHPLRAAAVVATGFGIAINKALGDISRVTDEAFELGVDPNVLLGIEHAFDGVGVSAQEVHESLRRLTIAGGEAERGNEKLKQTFRSLGIDLRSFEAQTADQRLRSVAEGLSKIESPAKRAAVAAELFGRRGLSMLEILGVGTKGLDEAADRTRRLGNTIRDSGIKSVSEWEASTAKLRLAWSGLSKQVLQGPASLSVSAFASVMEVATSAFGEFIDIARAGKSAWDPMTRSLDVIIPKIKELNKEVLRGIQLTEQASHAEQLAFEEKFSGFMSKAREDAASLIETLNFTTPLDEFENKMRRIHELHGMDLVTLEQRNKLLMAAQRTFLEPQIKQQMEARAAMMEEADELRERLATPLERFQKSLVGLQRLRGFGAIDPRTFGRGLKEAAMEFREATMGFLSQPVTGPAAVERGTQEAFRAFQETKAGVEQQREQLAVQRKMEAHLARIARGGVVFTRAPLT